jgi:radical SAM-linked protein
MVNKDFLVREWEKAVSAEHTPDCRHGNCSSCGACDFKRLLPIVNKPVENAIGHMEADRGPAPVSYRRLAISYAKKGDARFFGHLEMVNIFLRAFMRTKISVEFSRGFHPMPRISFDDPLPIGMESVSEGFYIMAAETENPENVVDKLNAHLPEGLRIQACRIVPPHFKPVRHPSITYMVQTKDSLFDKNTVEYFKKIHQFPIFREDRKKGRTEVDLKSVVLDMEWTGQNTLTMTLKNAPGLFIRPAEILKAIFNLSDEDIKLVRTTKIGDSNG